MTEPLPGVLAEIAEVVGDVAAIQIAAHKGGTLVYFPARITESHWLSVLIGFDKAKKLCQHFTDRRVGQRIDIPLFTNGTYKDMQRKIAKRIHDMDADDASSAKIARTLGITHRTVHRHRSRHRGGNNKRQGTLKF